MKPVGWADKLVVAQNQVEMDLISHNSTRDVPTAVLSYSGIMNTVLHQSYVICQNQIYAESSKRRQCETKQGRINM